MAYIDYEALILDQQELEIHPELSGETGEGTEFDQADHDRWKAESLNAFK